MGKQIYYIDYYVKEKRQGTIGFLRIGTEKIEFILKNIPLRGIHERNIYLINPVWKEKQLLAKIVLKEGIGQLELEKGVVDGNIAGIIVQIPITSYSYGMCTMNNMKMEMGCKVEDKTTESEIEPVIEANKWMQICKSYPNIHIFPQTQSVLIKPKDLVILNHDYHGLATNSFLLHAYYNYRQLLLIRKREEEKYYVGVPGVYHDRERQLAVMFGFSDFENGESQLENGNRREVYTGCFGYYKKRVDI